MKDFNTEASGENKYMELTSRGFVPAFQPFMPSVKYSSACGLKSVL